MGRAGGFIREQIIDRSNRDTSRPRSPAIRAAARIIKARDSVRTKKPVNGTRSSVAHRGTDADANCHGNVQARHANNVAASIGTDVCAAEIYGAVYFRRRDARFEESLPLPLQAAILRASGTRLEFGSVPS